MSFVENFGDLNILKPSGKRQLEPLVFSLGNIVSKFLSLEYGLCLIDNSHVYCFIE